MRVPTLERGNEVPHLEEHMKLRKWDKEPRTYSLMTCYCGKVEKLG